MRLTSRAAVTGAQAVVLVVVIVVAAAASGFYYYYTSAQSKPFITFATWGGSYTNSFNQTIVKFEQQNGVQVKIFTQSASGETLAKITAEKSAPTIDIFFSGAFAGVKGAPQGLFVNITTQNVPNLAHIPVDLRYANFPSVVPYDLLAEGWFVNPSLIPPGHEFNGSAKWFFDPIFKGKIAVPTPEYTFFIEWCSQVAG